MILTFLRVIYLSTVFSLLLVIISCSAYSPVSTTSYENTLYLSVPDEFENKNRGQWNTIEATLVNTNYSTYVLEWQGYGGLVQMGEEMISSITKAKAQGKTIVIRLKGDSYSMHAIVPCYASVIENRGNLLMYHPVSYTVNKKTYRETNPTSRYTRMLNQCVAVGILSPSDPTTIWAGTEIWVRGSQKQYIPDTRPAG